MPMSRAPRRFARGVVALDPVRPRLDLARTRTCPTTTSRLGQPRWSAILRSRKFSSFDRCAEPRKKTPGGPGRPRSVARISAAIRSTAARHVRVLRRRRRSRTVGLVDVAGVQALGEEAAVVAEPVVVDVRVQPRQEAVDDRRPWTRSRCCSRCCSPGRPTASSAGTRRGCGSGTPRRSGRRRGRRPRRSRTSRCRARLPSCVQTSVRPPRSRNVSSLGPGDLLGEADAARALDAARHVGDDVRADHRAVEASGTAACARRSARAGCRSRRSCPAACTRRPGRRSGSRAGG